MNTKYKLQLETTDKTADIHDRNKWQVETTDINNKYKWQLETTDKPQILTTVTNDK